MSEACDFCGSYETGPSHDTPHGICAKCACPTCRGFRVFDDRGFLFKGQPCFSTKDCDECAGEGTSTAWKAKWRLTPEENDE